ncbi:hypothetical protein KGM_209883 [Danaus plexippus plexippus]|uniref:Uncharacterized protein n=1 Tax=Danaus plexippus plexippus TaxID=278856 RepID=A0A212EK46_DANPL|nr:hypothetical protein KGM_209883 [Danaus plexippus plexippus]
MEWTGNSKEREKFGLTDNFLRMNPNGLLIMEFYGNKRFVEEVVKSGSVSLLGMATRLQGLGWSQMALAGCINRRDLEVVRRKQDDTIVTSSSDYKSFA